MTTKDQPLSSISISSNTSTIFSLHDLARNHVDQGLLVLPTYDYQKYPRDKWRDVDHDTAWRAWNDEGAAADATGAWSKTDSWARDLVCFDLDIYDETRLNSALAELGLTEEGVRVETVSGGLHVWALWPDRPPLEREFKLPDGGAIETRSCDHTHGIMLPLSRANSDKGATVRRGTYTCEDPSVFFDLAALPVLSDHAVSRLAPRFAEKQAARPTHGDKTNGIEQLKKALMGFLNAETFPLLADIQFGKGNRTKFFFAVGHSIGAHAWHPMPSSELADLMFPLVADAGFVDWSDDSAGEKRSNAQKQFHGGISAGREYAAAGKKSAIARELESLGLQGKKYATESDVEAMFRSVFDGSAHLRVHKSGVKITGFTFLLLPGSPDFHLSESRIAERGVRAVQLAPMANKSEFFCEIIRTLGIDSDAAQAFLNSAKNFPKVAYRLLYAKGSSFQTQVDWKAELVSAVHGLMALHDADKYKAFCENLETSERSRLWYRTAPRTEGTDSPRVIKDQPWISGIKYSTLNDLHLLASKDWWDRFLRDHSDMDGIQQWWLDHSVSLCHRDRWKVKGIPLSELLECEEGVKLS